MNVLPRACSDLINGCANTNGATGQKGAGHEVHGMTRSQETAQRLRSAGVLPVIVDVYDAREMHDHAVTVRPNIVIHQLTDLPPGLVSDRMDEFIRRNSRLRMEGTANLVSASLAAGATRIVAQSIAWAYRTGPVPHKECDPLDLAAEGNRAISVAGVISLEEAVLGTLGIEGIVLRYGHLYGPGTGFDEPGAEIPLHVDAAACAAFIAIDSEASGIFNIAENDPGLSTERARKELGWKPDWRWKSNL